MVYIDIIRSSSLMIGHDDGNSKMKSCHGHSQVDGHECCLVK